MTKAMIIQSIDSEVKTNKAINYSNTTDMQK